MNMNKKKFAVLGFPVEHSLSPVIHNSFAKQINIDISYSKIKVDLKRFKEVVIQLRDEKFTGVNVTVPLKFEALKVSATSSDNAKLSKAANCLSFKNNRIIQADNTDGFGLVKDLSNKKIDLMNLKILIIGAGGATSGVLPSLIQCKPKLICVANRTMEKAEKLVCEFGQFDNHINLQFDSLSLSKFSDYDLIINATSASLNNNVIEIPKNLLDSNPILYDMMYGPKSNLFLSQAKGEKKFDGIGMLVEQAAQSFNIWHGFYPNTSEVIKSLESLTNGS